MIAYFSIFLALVFIGLHVKSKVQTNFALVVFGAFLLIFMGTRRDTGCDFSAYEARFRQLYSDTNYISILTREEPGFHLLNLYIHYLGLDYMWLNLIGSLIFIIALIRFVKIAPTPVLMLALMFPIMIIQLGMSGLRQALAVAFLLQSYISFLSVRRINAGLWVFLAAQFHSSAYIFLPLAFMAGRQFTWKTAFISLILTAPASVFLLGDRADVYSDRYIEQIYGENSSSGAVLRYMLALFPYILFELNKRRVQAQFKTYYPIFRISSLITFSLFFIGLISTVILHRLTFYILPLSSLVFICTVMVIPRANMLSRKLLYVPTSLYLIYIIGWFTLSRHSSICYIPYDSYLF